MHKQWHDPKGMEVMGRKAGDIGKGWGKGEGKGTSVLTLFSSVNKERHT